MRAIDLVPLRLKCHLDTYMQTSKMRVIITFTCISKAEIGE